MNRELKLKYEERETVRTTDFAPHTPSRGGAVVARRAHNPKVVGSNPAPATKILSPRAFAQV
ncbi:hypothetical protein (tRNA associated) [Candidatus Desulfosporosinus infrequens]|uniref:Uncharacterized protein n=1 Tax=Candidatus Desulfosporosinus infrequens TaxID=2043169 RepID=A0A2U3JWR1_9FIRM|nr:hypothetical protein (tRNA associated) [Candidatus Desulfosporosinus infrequens]